MTLSKPGSFMPLLPYLRVRHDRCLPSVTTTYIDGTTVATLGTTIHELVLINMVIKIYSLYYSYLTMLFMCITMHILFYLFIFNLYPRYILLQTVTDHCIYMEGVRENLLFVAFVYEKELKTMMF